MIFHRRSFVAVAAASLVLQACTSTPPPAPVAPSYRGPTLGIAQTERGVSVFLPSSVLFETGKAEFNKTAAEPYLVRVAQLLTDKTSKQVVVEGHTDNIGSDGLNQRLSEDRARNVLQALADHSVPQQRMSAAGYSFKRPIASNANEDGRRVNRRVELVIIDEKVENITRGEPSNAFESAFDQLKAMVDKGLVRLPESQP